MRAPLALALWILTYTSKTRIALEYALRHKASQVSVFWIHASSKTRILDAYAEIARRLNIIGYKEAREDGPRLVKEWFESEASGRWLIVMDNADDHDLLYGADRLADFLPHSENGSILMTTRDKKVGLDFAGASRLRLVEPLNSDQAQSLLISKFSDEIDPECCRRLSEELEGIPLAIVQASAFMHQYSINAEEYLSLYRQSPNAQIDLLSEDFEDKLRDRESRNPIAATWLISFEYIEKKFPLAGELLKKMSMLDSQAITVSLIQSQESPQALIKALGTLQAFCLITARVFTIGKHKTTDKSYDLHRLVRLAMRNWLKQRDQLYLWTARTLKIVSENFPDVETTGWAKMDRCSAYLPHAVVLLSSDELKSTAKGVASIFRSQWLLSEHVQDEVPCAICAADLMTKLSFTFENLGHQESSITWAREAVSLRTFVFGEGHCRTIEALIRAAAAHYYAGQVKTAIGLGEKAVLLIDASDQPPPALVAWKLDIIAFIEMEDGKDTIGVEQYFRKALKIRMGIFGPDHPDVLRTKENLSEVCHNQGRYEESEELLKAVIESLTRTSGPASLGTLRAKLNLALYYTATGHDDRALELNTEVSTLQANKFGPRDPQTIMGLIYSAVSLYGHGRYSKAKELCQHALELSTEVNGADSVITVEAMSILALCCAKKGNKSEAEELMIKVMECHIRLGGDKNSGTIEAMRQLASLYTEEERYKKAQPLREKVVEIEIEKLGRQSPETILSMCVLGLNYTCQGLHDKAAKYQYSALTYPLGNPEAKLPGNIRRMASIAMDLVSNENLVEAEKMARDAVRLARLHANPVTYRTVPSLVSLAFACSNLNKTQEAEKLYREALDILNLQSEGEKDLPSTMTNLASVLLQEGRYEEADFIASEAKKKLAELPELDEWTAVFNARTLATVYTEQGRYREAEVISCDILAQQLDEAWKPGDFTVSSILEILSILENLARTCDFSERYQQAESIYEKTLAVRNQLKGSTNSQTLRVMSHYIGTLNSQGRYTEALKLGVDCKKRYQQEARQDTSPDKMVAASIDKEIALAYLGLGKYTDAEPIAREALDMSFRNLGENHPLSLDFLATLAKILGEQHDNFLEIKEMSERVLNKWIKLVGEKHLKTIRAMEALAKIFEKEGGEEEARTLKVKAEVLTQSLYLGLDGEEKRKLDKMLSRTFQRLNEKMDLVSSASNLEKAGD